jgi:hypothetical protein
VPSRAAAAPIAAAGRVAQQRQHVGAHAGRVEGGVVDEQPAPGVDDGRALSACSPLPMGSGT